MGRFFYFRIPINFGYIHQQLNHCDDVIMNAVASQITSLGIVNSTVYSGTDERKRDSSASLAFVRGIHRWPVNSPHKGPVTRKMFPFNDVIMLCIGLYWILVITATNRNGQNLNGHKPKRPQTGTATDRNGHKPKRPQNKKATDRNGHKLKRPQTERPQTGTATYRNGHKPERPQIEIDTTTSDSAGYKFLYSIEASN